MQPLPARDARRPSPAFAHLPLFPVLKRAILFGGWLVVALTLGLSAPAAVFGQGAGPQISEIRVLTPGPIERYAPFEVAFDITNSVAANPYWPYETTPPTGVPAGTGISVDASLLPPGSGDWSQALTLPCFYYQPVEELGTGARAGLAPVGPAEWRCRFTPEVDGAWQYRMRAKDAGGVAASAVGSFDVIPSNRKGFVRVSETDPQRFAFSDGSPFNAPLVNVELGSPFNGLEKTRASIRKFSVNGVRFLRWLPTGEGGNYDVIPFGDDIKSSWAFGQAGTDSADVDTAAGKLFSYAPYYYTGQRVPGVPGARYRLNFRAKIAGDKVFIPEITSSGGSLGQLTVCANPAVCADAREGWSDYTLEVTNGGGTSLYVALHEGRSETDPAGGSIRLHSIRLQRDETGAGGWGPNLLARGDPDTYNYVDQVGAARLDEALAYSAQYGVYHKLALFHKNDSVLGRLGANGATTSWSLNNFYSAEGQAVRWYERAYARYFVARWSYSTALHSVELANENDLNPASYDAAFAIAQTIKDLSPRHILQTNSFWGWYVQPFWLDPARGGLMDYADKHWYAAVTPQSSGELVSGVWSDSAANVRECRRRFKQHEDGYALGKPIVRGETGVAVAGTQPQHPDIARDPTGIYYKKQIWAQVGMDGNQCAGDWYTNTLDQLNLWPLFAAYERYLADEPLNSGGWQGVGDDLTGMERVLVTSADGNLRAWGQREDNTGRTLLWIDNAVRTWKNVVNGAPILNASGTLGVQGLPPGAYRVEWWDTTAGAMTQTETRYVAPGEPLTLDVMELVSDVAVKLVRVGEPEAITPPAATATCVPPTATPTVTPTATPAATATPTATPTATATPTSPVANAIHVSDLDGEVTMPSSSLWNVVVTVRVHDAVHQPAAGVGVLAAWNDGSSVSCNTDGNGICRMSRNLSFGDDPSVSLTVNRIARKGWVYVADDNYDPDGDSDGVRIVIARPSEVHAINSCDLSFPGPNGAAGAG